jgi:hypothetical protein
VSVIGLDTVSPVRRARQTKNARRYRRITEPFIVEKARRIRSGHNVLFIWLKAAIMATNVEGPRGKATTNLLSVASFLLGSMGVLCFLAASYLAQPLTSYIIFHARSMENQRGNYQEERELSNLAICLAIASGLTGLVLGVTAIRRARQSGTWDGIWLARVGALLGGLVCLAFLVIAGFLLYEIANAPSPWRNG